MTDLIKHHTNDLYQDIDPDGILASIGRSSPVIRAPKIPTTEEIKMSRMTYDGLLLQSQLGVGEVREMGEIAQSMFCREGEEAGKVAMNRARSAMLNLVTMQHAKAVPNKKTMTHIMSVASPGTQLAALMNINTRKAEQGRQHDRRAIPSDDCGITRESADRPVIADLPGTIHSIMNEQ